MSVQNNVFQRVKEIPIQEVLERYGVELHPAGGGRSTCHCIFHEDQHPSLVVYSNDFHCFVCGAHGDAVSFIARLLNVRPLVAAQDIAQRFGLLVDMPGRITPALRQQAEEAAHQHQLEQRFRAWCNRAYIKAASMFRNINGVLDSFEAYCKIPNLVHALPVIEHHLDVLQFGSDDDRIALYQERGRHFWL